MEAFYSQFVSVEKNTMINGVGCELDMKCREQMVSGLPAFSSREVICPAPRRAARDPYIIDNLNRLFCKPKNNFSTCKGNKHLDTLSLILSKDNEEDDLDSNINQMGFFCGSPPVRTNNPLIHDVQFVQQTSTHASSPLGSSHGGKSRVERSSFCGASSLGGKPLVRIEGFSCGNSNKSNRIVQTLA
ncbi:hypothetical protein GIB67_012410 [Kingdonia uniflora]|uniref:Uncharacterized protein n=1 Tax=Kingdonia uniflora TaxID=39325 RepID=A0A7J7LLR1_9MAGN|nr:hypothetical protein GIB67_012410 [Kingdonia uniflora]